MQKKCSFAVRDTDQRLRDLFFKEMVARSLKSSHNMFFFNELYIPGADRF